MHPFHRLNNFSDDRQDIFVEGFAAVYVLTDKI